MPEEVHCEAHSGHFGVEKTYNSVAADYFWPGIYHDTVKFVTTCVRQRNKSAQTGQQGLMGKRIVETPCTAVACDLMELVPSKRGYKYLIVFQDLFTRMI